MAREPEIAIRMRGVTKRFGPITAVDGLDLDVPAGTCVGLLGPNGAGKSTTMKMLTAQAIADEGELEVLGYSLPRESKQARAECGVVPQLDNLDTTLTVEQNLYVFAWLYRLGRGERGPAVERALEIANLNARRDTRVDELSGGMRRRLLIARALVHRPRLVLLDEPTVGLDPQVRQELWALIDSLRTEGVSILMSTHYIEEAERLADTVTIMAEGRAVVTGRPTDLVAEHAGSEVLEVYGPPARLAEVEQTAVAGGLRTRRTGTSVAVVGIEDANGFSHDGRPPARQPRGRLRPPDRRGHRMTAGTAGAAPAPARAAGVGGRALPRDRQLLVVLAVGDVLVDGRADDLPARLRLRVRLARLAGGRIRLRRVRRHRDGRDRGALLERVPGDVLDVREVPLPADVRRDPGGPRRHRGAGDGRGALDRRSAPGCTAAPRSSSRSRSASIRGRRWSSVPFIGFVAGYGWAGFGITVAATMKSIDNFSYVISAVITPLFLVAGTFFPITGLPEWAQHLAQLNPLYHTVQLVRHAAFGFEIGSDLVHWGVLLVFGLTTWRVAIWRMTARLVM